MLLPLLSLSFSGFLRMLVVSRDGCGDGPSGRREHEKRVPIGRLSEDVGLGVVLLLGGCAQAELPLNVRAQLSIALFRSGDPLSVRGRRGGAAGLGDPAGERRRARNRKHGLERDRDRLHVRRGAVSSGEIHRRVLGVDRSRCGE